MQVEAYTEVQKLIESMFNESRRGKDDDTMMKARLVEAHTFETNELQCKIRSLEDDITSMVAQLKKQDKAHKVLKEECEDRIAVFVQREDALKIEMLDREKQLQH